MLVLQHHKRAALLKRGLQFPKRLLSIMVLLASVLGWSSTIHAALPCDVDEYLLRTELFDSMGDGTDGYGYVKNTNSGFQWLTYGSMPILFDIDIQEVCVPAGQYTFAYYVYDWDIWSNDFYFWIYVDNDWLLEGGGGYGDNYYGAVSNASDTDFFYLDIFELGNTSGSTDGDTDGNTDDGSCVHDITIQLFDSWDNGNDGEGALKFGDEVILALPSFAGSEASHPVIELCPGLYTLEFDGGFYPQDFSFSVSDDVGLFLMDTSGNLLQSAPHEMLPAQFYVGGDGTMDGVMDGDADGFMEGDIDGDIDGAADGGSDGDLDGDLDGDADGQMDMDAGGFADGDADGLMDIDAGGFADGGADGLMDIDAGGFADGGADGLVDVDAGGFADGGADGLVGMDAGSEGNNESNTLDGGNAVAENLSTDAGVTGVAMPTSPYTPEPPQQHPQLLVESGCGCNSQSTPSSRNFWVFYTWFLGAGLMIKRRRR